MSEPDPTARRFYLQRAACFRAQLLMCVREGDRCDVRRYFAAKRSEYLTLARAERKCRDSAGPPPT